MTGGPVVVGVDGSRASLAAVEVAAREADRRGVELRLTQVVGWPTEAIPAGVAPWDPDGVPESGRHDGHTEALARAREIAPGTRVTCEVLLGDPARVLESASHGASLVVVGGSRPMGPGGPRRDEVVGLLADRAACPVVVVNDGAVPTGSVVLAAGTSAAAGEATEYAFAEASARGVPLVALAPHVLWNARRDRNAASELARAGRRHPDVTVRRVRVRGRIRRALGEVAAAAQCVVLGGHGRVHGHTPAAH